MKKIKYDKKALRKSTWASLSRVLGVGLAAGAGNLLHGLVGGGAYGYGTAVLMAIVSFVFMLIAEYHREKRVPSVRKKKEI
jgi:uncharacterized membrane protein